MPDGQITNQSGGTADAPSSPVASQGPQGTAAQASQLVTPGPNMAKLTPPQRMRASLAAAKAADKAAKAKAAPAPVEAPGAQLDPVAAKVAEIGKRLQEKRAREAEASKAQPETAQSVAAKLDPALLRTEKGREHIDQWAKATGVDIIDLFSALNDYADALEAESKANPLEKRLSAIEKEREAERQRQSEQIKAAQVAGARKAFMGSVTADKFPLLSNLSEDEIWARGIEAAQALTDAGEDADAETIAALAEVQLRKLHSKLARKAGENTTAGSAEPRTLSGSLGGETPAPPKYDSGKDGPRERMRAQLQRMRGATT